LTTAERFHAKTEPEPNSGCWIWLGSRDRQGYGYFAISKRQIVKAHRFAVIGEQRRNEQVLHRCDNPSCVNPSHLFLGSNLDNRRDSLLKGRVARGNSHGMSKLSEQSVSEIRAERARGITLAVLAARYGVGQNVVSAVARGIAWRHA